MTASIIQVFNVELALAAIAALVGGIVHGFSGFGVGLIMVPGLAILLGPVEAVAIASITSVTGTASLIPGAVRNMDRPLIWPILAPTLIAVPAGSYLLLLIDPLIMQRSIGAFVFALGLLLMSGFRWRGPRSTGVGITVGTVGGLVGGSASVAGPIFSAYILSSDKDALTMRAGALVVATWVGLVTVVALAVAGAIGLETVVRSVVLFFPNVIAIWAGARLFLRSSDVAYRRVAFALLLLAGTAAMVV